MQRSARVWFVDNRRPMVPSAFSRRWSGDVHARSLVHRSYLEMVRRFWLVALGSPRVPVMSNHFALSDIAERIAVTENKLVMLRERIGRLKAEGSDAARDEIILVTLTSTLGQLYRRQTTMRRTNWVGA